MNKEKNVIALLPLKGHSQRVPHKNIRHCGGKPLMLWILDTLLHIQTVERVVVNTDSDEIVGIINKLDNTRIVVHRRPRAMQGDEVSMNKIIAYDIDKYPSKHYLQTHATNPLLSSSTIDDAITAYFSKLDLYDSLYTVNKHQARFYDHNHAPINHDPNNLIPTQNLDPVYEENSNIYIFSATSFKATNTRIGVSPQLFPMNKHEALDIDTIEDFRVADIILTDSKGV